MLSVGYKEAVRTIRRRKGLTQEECAERVDMKAKLWSKYETGAVRITAKALARMREALECSKAELFHLALPYQRAFHQDESGEIREGAQAYGTKPIPTNKVKRILALDENALPAEERHWFKVERDDVAAILSRAQDMADNLTEKYLDHIARARRAQDAEDDKNRQD